MTLHRTIGLFLVSFILLIACSPCNAQKLLYSKNRYKQVYYEIGDVLSFRIKGERLKISKQITGFEDSLIVFRDIKINPNRITHLYVDAKTKNWHFMRFKYKRLFLYAGVGYFVLDVLNSGEVDKETVVVSGSLIAAGLLAKWLISDRIKMKGRRRLYITH